MAADTTATRHPVSRAVAELRRQVAELLQLPLFSMDAEEAGDTLLEVTRLGAQVDALQTQVLTHATTVEVEAASGATSTPNWWAHQSGLTRRQTHATARLAEGLTRHPAVAERLGAGDLVTEQAAAIVRALDDLATDLATSTDPATGDPLDPGIAQKAEAFLLEQATNPTLRHDAKALRVMGRRLLDVVDPDAADAREAALLAQEEAHAAATTRLTMTDDGHGRVHGRFTLPTLHGAIFKKALLALAAPKHQNATRPNEDHDPEAPRRPSPERLGQAFVEYLERYPADRLPDAGGLAAAIVVTMDHATLIGGLAAASLDTGDRVSPSQARRLACEAGLIPAVLGTGSHVLDVGRTARFHNRAQRIAIAIRDQHCTALGCNAPPALCHVHHDDPWSRGGHTTVKDGRLLCPRHHTKAHDPTYEMRRQPDGTVTFHRRC